MKKKCILSKIDLINSISKKFIQRKIKEDNLPILLNHAPLFFILPEDGSPLVFNEISNRWGISKSSLSDIINKYESIGLISKVNCIKDKRNIYVILQPKGLLIKNKLKEMEVEFLDIMLKDFEKNERENFEDNINKALRSIERIL